MGNTSLTVLNSSCSLWSSVIQMSSSLGSFLVKSATLLLYADCLHHSCLFFNLANIFLHKLSLLHYCWCAPSCRWYYMYFYSLPVITTLASHFLPGWYSPLLLVSWHHYCHATSEGHLTMLNLNISTIDINGIFIFTPMQYKPMLLNLWAPPPFFLIHGQWHAKHKKMSKNPRRNAVLVYPCLVFYC